MVTFQKRMGLISQLQNTSASQLSKDWVSQIEDQLRLVNEESSRRMDVLVE